MTAPEPSDLGRFEPTPYDLGITDDPEAAWADVQAEPVPFTLTGQAEAALDSSPEPEAEL